MGKRRYLRARSKRAPRILALVLSLLVLTGSGCDSGSDPESAPQKTYRIGIDIPFHPLFNYVSVNTDEYFEGFDVEFRILDTSTLIPAFGTGDLDVIATFPTSLPRIEQAYGFVAQEFLPLARIQHGMAVWVPVDSPARNLADLRGSKVAVAPLGQQWGEDEAMVMIDTGARIKDYFQVQESGAPVQQLLLGRVDAAFVTGEATAVVAEDGGFRPLVSSDEIFARELGDPFVLSGGMAASREFIGDNPAFIERLIESFNDAWTKFRANPEAVAEVAAKEGGLSSEQVLGFSNATGLLDMPQRTRQISQRDVTTWGHLYRALARSGFLKTAPRDPSKYFLITE